MEVQNQSSSETSLQNSELGNNPSKLTKEERDTSNYILFNYSLVSNKISKVFDVLTKYEDIEKESLFWVEINDLKKEMNYLLD